MYCSTTFKCKKKKNVVKVSKGERKKEKHE
jgi:hypothetical protein